MHRISIAHGRFNTHSFNFNIRNTQSKISHKLTVSILFFRKHKVLVGCLCVYDCAHRSMTSVQSYDRRWIISCVSSRLCTLDGFYIMGERATLKKLIYYVGESGDQECCRIWRAWCYKYCLLSSTDSIQKSCGFSETVCTAYLNSQRL